MQKAGADVVAGTKFTDFIALHNGGDTDHECSVKLAEVVAGIRKTKQPGALSLRIDLAPINGDVNQLIVTVKPSGKVPEESRRGSVFFTTEAGALVREDPRQMRMPLEE